MSNSAGETFLKLTQTKGRVDTATVEKSYNALKLVTIEAMIGEWQGGSLDTGHPGHTQMLSMNWAGKTFLSADEVQPIIVYDAVGKRRYAKEISKGGARLREVKFRGVVSTAMIYDSQAIIDHFRWVDENTVAGAMDTGLMPEAGTYYFYLKRL